jgi:hypothetical protein
VIKTIKIAFLRSWQDGGSGAELEAIFCKFTYLGEDFIQLLDMSFEQLCSALKQRWLGKCSISIIWGVQ